MTKKKATITIDVDTVKKYLPYILMVLTNGGSAIGGGLYQGGKVETDMASVLSMVTSDIAKNVLSHEEELRKDFEHRIKICKETRGKICKIN